MSRTHGKIEEAVQGTDLSQRVGLSAQMAFAHNTATDSGDGTVASTKAAAIGTDATSGTASTPTVTEFLDGAISEYVIGGTPDGMQPFLVDGKQMTLHDDATGAVAHAWITEENQVLITYAGTTRGENILVDPLATVGGLASDVGILLQKTSPAQAESLAFARQVVAAAGAQGYAQDQVFVTGHSLGGIEAEYVAQQTGLGGIGFEPTGIQKDAESVGDGSNFVNVVTYGDPVANYSSDIAGEQPFAPSYVPASQGGGQLPHYGSILQIGAPEDQAALSSASELLGHAFSGDKAAFTPLDAVLHPGSVVAGVAEMVPLIIDYHFPAAEYAALGVTPTGGFLDRLPSYIGAAHGPVLSLGSDTIPQLQQFIAGQDHTGV